MNIIVIDNGNSSTYNIVNEFEKKNCTVTVYRNTVDFKVVDNAIKKIKPKLIVLSGGSETQGAGICHEVVLSYHQSIPLFGIGFGLQCIVSALEGRIDRATAVMHGKTSKVVHDGKTIFKGLADGFTAGRYNSLAVYDVPYSLEISARDENNTVMAVRHKELPVEGVAFHPESILTPSGSKLFDNVLLQAKK